MNKDIIRIIKGFEREFFEENPELYKNDRIEFAKKRENFISKKLEEMKEHDER